MPGECSVAELRNGSIVITMRSPGPYGAQLHAFSRSDDLGASWSPAWRFPRGEGSSVFASLMSAPGVAPDELYLATPAQPTLGAKTLGGDTAEAGDGALGVPRLTNHLRSNLTIHASNDGGATWTHKALVHDGLSAYSDMTWMAERGGGIGVLFERGVPWHHDDRQYSAVAFAFVPVR